MPTTKLTPEQEAELGAALDVNRIKRSATTSDWYANFHRRHVGHVQHKARGGDLVPVLTALIAEAHRAAATNGGARSSPSTALSGAARP